MHRFVLRRLVLMVPVLFGVTLLVFSMLHLTPGDPVRLMFQQIGEGQEIPPEVVTRIREDLGLDEPLPVQYVTYIGRVVQGDLGRSIARERPVTEIIRGELPYTAELAVWALIFSVSVGVPLGVVAALRRGGWLDSLTMLLASLGVSMPNFWFALLAIMFFSVSLGVLPVSGYGSAAHLVLPAATLGLSSAAVIARMTRSSLLEILNEDHIRTARAKGLAERIVVVRHSLRNAMIPVVTIIGLQLGSLMGGTVVVETVFARRGLGSLMISALLGKDFPLVQALILFSAIVYVLANLAVDLLYGIIDPRIRFE